MIPITDLHTDLIHSYLEFGNDQLFKEVRKQMTINLLKCSPVKFFFAAFSGDDEGENTLEQLEVYQKLFTQNNIGLVKNKDDFLKKTKNCKTILHIEGGGYIKSLKDFDMFYKNGIRSIGLAYGQKNSLCCGATIKTKDDGLTKLGRDVINLSNKNGVVVDLAHASKKTFDQTVHISTKPVIVTHTACQKILNHPRNISDRQIKIIAKNNGLIGIFFSKAFISNKQTVDSNDVLKHFVHVSNLIGTKYLAIGSDFAGISTGTPIGLEGYHKFNEFLAKMHSVGFSNSEVKDIAYKNVQRVLSNILI